MLDENVHTALAVRDEQSTSAQDMPSAGTEPSLPRSSSGSFGWTRSVDLAAGPRPCALPLEIGRGGGPAGSPGQRSG